MEPLGGKMWLNNKLFKIGFIFYIANFRVFNQLGSKLITKKLIFCLIKDKFRSL